MSTVRIVLDTNAFYGDVHATRDRFRALLASVSAGDVEVIVPQIVLDELTRQYPERLGKAKADLDKAIARIETECRRLGVSFVSPTLAPPIDPKDYIKQLRRRLVQSQIRVTPHPRDFSSFIGRCVAKRKPFKDSGGGLPDALVWAAVVAAARHGEVILVTSNTKDFSDPAEPAQVHSDLAADLAAMNVRSNRVRIVPDIDSLIEVIIKPLALPDARAERLIRNTAAGARLRSGIADSLTYESVPESSINLDVELLEDPRIIGMRIRDLRVNVARELAPGRLLLDLDVTANLELEAYVDADNDELDYSSDITVVDRHQDDDVVEGLAEIVAELRVELTTDLDAHQVDGVELKSINAS